jgi:hypothetical protein
MHISGASLARRTGCSRAIMRRRAGRETVQARCCSVVRRQYCHCHGPALAQTPSRSPRTQQLQHPPRRNLAVAWRLGSALLGWDGACGRQQRAAFHYQHLGAAQPLPVTRHQPSGLVWRALHTVCGSWDDFRAAMENCYIFQTDAPSRSHTVTVT